MRRKTASALLTLVLGACASPWAWAGPSASAPAPAPASEIGALSGVGYRIDVPAHWNRELIVFFHGYTIDPIAFEREPRLSPMFDPMLGQGYAVIQSAYSATGWAVEQGDADSERLRRYFVDRFGTPKRTFAMGMSMGGTLAVLALESRPTTYGGGLTLCGAIDATDRLIQHDFSVRAAFDYYFPDVLGGLVPVPKEYLPNAETEAKVAAALAANPRALDALLRLHGSADAKNLAPVIASITYDIKEMQQRTRGNPFGNAEFIYTGSGDDFALNDGVRRYRADPRAFAIMTRWYTPNGKLLHPLLALHDTGDPLVPASSAFEYALMTRRAGYGDNFVQQYVNREGHCVFTPAEIGRAFDELVEWSASGKRPASGKLP